MPKDYNDRASGKYGKEVASINWDGTDIQQKINALIQEDERLAKLIAELNVDVDGIAFDDALTVIKGATVGAQLRAIDLEIHPIVNPTYQVPTLALALSVSTLQKIGQTITFNVVATFNRGAILLGATHQNDRAGLPDIYTFVGEKLDGATLIGGSWLKLVESNALVVSAPVTNLLLDTLGNMTFECQVYHLIGAQPLNSRGQNYGAQLPAGDIPSLDTVKVTMRVVLPLYATIGSISTIGEIATLYNDSSANNIVMVMAPESGGNKQRFEIPKMWNDARPLKGIQVLDAFTNQYAYPGGTQAASLAQWAQSTTSHVFNSVAHDYIRFTHSGPDRNTTSIRLIF